MGGRPARTRRARPRSPFGCAAGRQGIGGGAVSFPFFKDWSIGAARVASGWFLTSGILIIQANENFQVGPSGERAKFIVFTVMHTVDGTRVLIRE